MSKLKIFLRGIKVLFSKPYLENQLILVGNKGSNPNVSSFSELKGKRIGVVKGQYEGRIEKQKIEIEELNEKMIGIQ